VFDPGESALRRCCLKTHGKQILEALAHTTASANNKMK
jgi:hypothetical protein